MKKYLLTILLIILGIPILALAHQPRLAAGNPIIVSDPEVSKAYYGQLAGEPVIYKIHSDKPFALYVNILLPYQRAGTGALPPRDISATVSRDGEQLAVLGGQNSNWEKYHEEFGYDDYWRGPEYKSQAPAGDYEVIVTSPLNKGKYALAVGEIESFSFAETVNVYKVLPQLKRDFFGKSPANFIYSPFGWGLILLMFTLAFIVGFAYRFLAKFFAERSVRGRSQNIGKRDRLIRLALAVALFFFAILTTWNPLILFFSGFCLFEAIFSWCGLYTALSKNTCPV